MYPAEKKRNIYKTQPARKEYLQNLSAREQQLDRSSTTDSEILQ